MSLIGNLISEIEVGAIDLDRCLSTHHELSDDDKFLLALADRKSRFKHGEGYTIESYLQRLPWVADKPSLLQQMILDEFGFRLGSVDSAKLADELCSRYPGLGVDLESQVRERLDQWNATLLSKAEFDALCDRFEEAVTEKQSPVIEDWLHLAPFASRVDLLRELLLIESYHIAESGSQPDWVQYHSRFPEYFELIEEVRVHQDEALRSRSRIHGATSNGEYAVASLNVSVPFSRQRTTSHSHVEQMEDHRQQGMASSTDELPESFGRYRVCSVLGKGGFGVVYHARDVQLERDVAIKVIQGASLGVSIRQSFLTEAQIVAALDHPNIVPVYDVGQNDDGDFFVVSKLIDGSDLSKRIKLNRPDRLLALRIVEQIAEALNYSHAKGLVHRDVKPGNILLDRQDRPYLADFGLALRETEERKQGDPLGTPAYMSPEQARGDGKRVDHRSDIYSLGVVLYELLTGRRPFFSDNLLNLIRLVATEDVRSPRVFDGTISQELERVCLKALARHASERYTVAGDFAEDIRWVISQPSLIPAKVPSASVPSGELATQSPSTPRTGPTRVVPKGLRSFEAADADFFLELLPGPFDRDGLPESLRFWKRRIEETEPEHTFKVGVMYGPSGCGKSSLMKAGLLPRLSAKITAIYAEASGDDTEARLMRVIRRRVPDAEGESLKEILSVIRRRKLVPTGGKLLIVIDQFEQWLFAEKDYAKSSLTDALFQCDGGTIQAVVLVREEFWSSVSRFLSELDIPLADRENSALVDLFDLEHATNVLGLFGRAFEKIPDSRKDWSEDQKEFINKSIEGLSEDRKVIPVRIAVFADMMRSRPWKTAALREIGGTEGVGFTFLEEMFGSKHAPIQHRQHQEAVRGVLSALLPDVGTDIKGAMQSADALQTAAGYERKPREFQELLGILDKNLRLITPVDEFVDDGGDNSETPESRIQSRSYQLAHDYLVPSLRSWLTQKQRETKKGRAELRLAVRAATWGKNPENKQLPTFWEWLTIERLTQKAKWRPAEQRLMDRASRYHSTRVGLFALSGLLLLLTGLSLKRWNDAVQLERDASNLISSITGADYGKLSDWIELSNSMRMVVDPKLKAALEKHDLQSDERLKLSLALLPSDPQQLDYLLSRLQSAEASQVPLMVSRLQPYASQIESRLWKAAHELDRQSLLQMASALAAYAPDSENWTRNDWGQSQEASESDRGKSFRTIAGQVADQVVQENPLRIAVWIETLRPAAKWLKPELQRIYAASPPARSQTEIDVATDILQSYAADDFQMLHELVLVGQPAQFKKIFGNYQRFSRQALDALREELTRPFSPENPEVSESEQQRLRVRYIARQANAAVALLRLGDTKPVYQFLTVDRNPEALSQFIYRIRGRDVSPLRLVNSFQELEGQAVPDDPVMRQQHYYRLYGSILGLGECTQEQLPAQQRDGLVTQLGEMYASHPSRAVHSALGWLLRRWGQDEWVRRVDETPLNFDESGVREWYVMKIDPPRKDNDESVESDVVVHEEAKAAVPKPLIDLSAPIYFTMIVFPGGEFEMGEAGETRKVKVAGPIAVSDREVTWRQFSPIDGDTHRKRWNAQPSLRDLIGDRQLQPGEPAFGVNWFEAVNYCRWLTEAAGMDESAQSYQQVDLPPGAESRPGWLELPAATEWPLRLDRPGFRLLTEAEWEYISRAGTGTEYGFGDDKSLLGEYCWYEANSDSWSHHTGLLRPSLGGLFDIHGNVNEWTDGWFLYGSLRVYRGGGWDDLASFCRSARRNGNVPSDRNGSLGFRLLLSPSFK